MDFSFEQTLVEVWRRVHVENAEVVDLGTERYPVRLTPKRHLKEVDFVFDGNEISQSHRHYFPALDNLFDDDESLSFPTAPTLTPGL